jgi:hypothetical protein
MGADKNSIQEFGLWTQLHSCTSPIFSCQVHVATGVLLNLGARPNQQSQHTRSETTQDTAAGSPNRSGWFLKPVRPLLLDLASRGQGKPVRPVRKPVRPILSRNSPKTPNTSNAFPHLNKRSHGAAKTSLHKDLSRQPTRWNRSDRFGKPVRPVLAWTVGKNTARGSTPPKPNLDLSNHSTNLNKTLGILGTPHEESIAKFNPTKTRPKRRNQGNPTNLGGEAQAKEPRRVPTNFLHQITKRKVPKTTQRNHQERAPKITTKNNREKHIQTLRNHTESSIHETEVHTRSSKPPDHPSLSTRSHHEALLLVLWKT